TIGEFVASSSALTSSRGGDRCRRCNRLRTRTSSLEGCRAAAAHRRSAPFLARAIHCKPVATGFRLADWTGSIRVVGSAQGRAAVECQALPPPDPSRTYETSELGARRSFGHVLNAQHRGGGGPPLRQPHVAPPPAGRLRVMSPNPSSLTGRAMSTPLACSSATVAWTSSHMR